MTANNDAQRLTAAEVLSRYKDEDLPAFSQILLQDVNQVGNFGERPLHVASVRGNIDEITALIEGGADVNAPGELSNTPLHEAVGQGHLEAIKALLAHGALVDKKNELGQSPIDTAILADRKNVLMLLRSVSKT